jgi:hypothetical protein
VNSFDGNFFELVVFYRNSSLKSFHWEFIAAINATFFARRQALICFSRAGAGGPSVRFEPHEIRHVVLLREPRYLLLLVLPYTPHQIVRDARIKHP